MEHPLPHQPRSNRSNCPPPRTCECLPEQVVLRAYAHEAVDGVHVARDVVAANERSASRRLQQANLVVASSSSSSNSSSSSQHSNRVAKLPQSLCRHRQRLCCAVDSHVSAHIDAA
jgi:hypothetical protein